MKITRKIKVLMKTREILATGRTENIPAEAVCPLCHSPLGSSENGIAIAAEETRNVLLETQHGCGEIITKKIRGESNENQKIHITKTGK